MYYNARHAGHTTLGNRGPAPRPLDQHAWTGIPHTRARSPDRRLATSGPTRPGEAPSARTGREQASGAAANVADGSGEPFVSAAPRALRPHGRTGSAASDDP